MGQFLQIERLEIIVTYRCNSNCSHCLIQPALHKGETLDPVWGANLVRLIGNEYHPFSVMTFGGEPILALESTLAIHRAATEAGIIHRQVISNGNWIQRLKSQKYTPLSSEESAKMLSIARSLKEAGVNDVELSLDAFHEEFLDPALVHAAYRALIVCGITHVRINPRWLESPTAQNSYDTRTRQLMVELTQLGIPFGGGEAVQPRGNALQKHQSTFQPFPLTGNERCSDVPNAPCLSDIRGLCISPNGEIILCNNIIIGDGTPESILTQLKQYNPSQFPHISLIQEKGLQGLQDLLKKEGVGVPKGPFYSVCDACFQYRRLLKSARTCNA
jgi:organic radical activating enzyme